MPTSGVTFFAPLVRLSGSGGVAAGPFLPRGACEVAALTGFSRGICGFAADSNFLRGASEEAAASFGLLGLAVDGVCGASVASFVPGCFISLILTATWPSLFVRQ